MADIKRKQLSILIDRMIPSHIIEDYPQYVAFIRAYFEYIEREFGEYDMITNILGYGDVDNASLVPAYLDEFKKQYIGVLPGNIAADTILLIKNIRSFYRAKGTEDSFRFLFRALYDKEIQFYYPSKDMLRVSDGKWTVPTYIIPTEQNPLVLKEWEGISFRNVDNTATGIMEVVQQIDDPTNTGTSVYAFLVSSVVGVFNNGDTIVALSSNPLPDLTISQYVEFNGYWKGDDGKISSNKKIQDSLYYQDFSYELQTDLSVIEYKELIKRVIHPAGMAMFGKFTIFDGTIINVPAVQTLALWLVEWEHTLQLLPSVGEMRTIVNTVVDYVRQYWTFGLVESNRENRLITDRFPNIIDFQRFTIADFSDPSANFDFLPSPQVQVLNNLNILTENGLDVIIIEQPPFARVVQ